MSSGSSVISPASGEEEEGSKGRRSCCDGEAIFEADEEEANGFCFFLSFRGRRERKK